MFFFFDNETCLEIAVCCKVINLVGAQWSSLNQLYFQSERVIRNRPLFIDPFNEYAVWFSGKYWMIGYLSNIEEGKLTYGFIFSPEENVVCPVDSEVYQELYSGSGNINSNMHLKCDGKSIR